MTPCRNVVVVRRIAVEPKLGRVWVPDQTADRLTGDQFEVLAVGAPPLYEEDAMPEAWHRRDDVTTRVHRGRTLYSRPVDPRVKPGAWVLLQPRMTMPTDQYGVFLTTTQAIMGVFPEN